MDTKEQLKLINKEIEEKTYQKDLIQSIESDLISLNKNIKNCISLIAASVKGKKANEIINNLTEENKRLTDQCNHTILEDKTKIYIKNAFLTFYVKDKITVPYIFISEFETVDQTLERIKKENEAQEDVADPYSTFGNSVTVEELDNMELPF